MSRKRTPDEKSTETTIAETSTAETTTAVAEPPAAETKAEGQTFAERVGQKKWKPDPDPFEIKSDFEAGIHLFRSRRDQQMAIKFDKKPPEAVLDKMREAEGWTWKRADGIWALSFTPDNARSRHILAERLYDEVLPILRQELGIGAGQEVPF
jgi:phage terminase large subunit-like protein